LLRHSSLEAQLRDLKAAGCDRIFREQLSSVDAKRPELEAAIAYARDGDVLVCTKLDRLADVVRIEAQLKAKGAALHIMDPAVDTSSPAGRLIFNGIASIAKFEREIMLTRQREGIAKAKRDGKYKGRKATAREHADEIWALHAANLKAPEIAAKLA